MKEHLKKQLGLDSYPSNWVIKRLLRDMKYSFNKSTQILELRNDRSTIESRYVKCLTYTWLLQNNYSFVYLDETGVDQFLIPQGVYSKKGQPFVV